MENKSIEARKKLAESRMDDLEEFIFEYMDCIMFKHYKLLKAGKTKLYLPKSNLEFSINAEGEFCLSPKGGIPFSEQPKAYEREDYLNFLVGLEELEPVVKGTREDYGKLISISKSGKGKVPDIKVNLKKAEKELRPMLKEFEDNIDKLNKVK